MKVWAAASAVAHPFLSAEFLAGEYHNIVNVHLPNAETWVWESDGSVLGFIALLGNEVGAIFVDPRFHRAGIGRALMDHARDLRQELEVEVFTENAIGRAFYASYGFELIQEKVHDQTGLDVMRLRLAANKRIWTPLPERKRDVDEGWSTAPGRS
ncbi:MAG: GNAT family N-acetyltransferase [Acidobacteriota bacterium]